MARHFREPEDVPAAQPAVPLRPVAPQRAPEPERRPKSNLISNILIAVGVIMLLVAGGLWLHAQWQYRQQDEVNQRLAAYAKVSDDEEVVPEVDWEGLRAINDDVVAWIQIPGTVVNYPVYQGTDNEYYLDNTAEGVYGVGGQIFLDYQCTAPGLVDQNSIIYGHHLKNGAMFKQVADMDQQDFFDTINTIWYVTPEEAIELEPLFVFYTNGDDTTLRQFTFGTPEEFHNYLTERLQDAPAAAVDAELIASQCEHVITLSTCNYIEGYGRTELVCVPKTEAADIRAAA